MYNLTKCLPKLIILFIKVWLNKVAACWQNAFETNPRQLRRPCILRRHGNPRCGRTTREIQLKKMFYIRRGVGEIRSGKRFLQFKNRQILAAVVIGWCLVGGPKTQSYFLRMPRIFFVLRNAVFKCAALPHIFVFSHINSGILKKYSPLFTIHNYQLLYQEYNAQCQNQNQGISWIFEE